MPNVLSSLLPTTEASFQADWTRQRTTAVDILQRLQTQEGVILADQVGMGKTYVALAVAVARILSTPELGQVVIFVPPAVADKWVREWKKFSESLLQPGTGIRCVEKPLRSGEAFLKALDDPPERMHHIVVVTHTALTATLKDSFVQLALLHFATRQVEDRALRQRIAKWSTGRDGLVRNPGFTPDRVAMLLDTPPAKWRAEWKRLTGEELDDDPVPEALGGAAGSLDFDELRAVIGHLPVRSSPDIAKRLGAARKELAQVTQSTWQSILSSTELTLPLLIVDEAHRLKNDYTQISKLFAPRSHDQRREGALANIFDRMLFLTATPFELGHAELIRVLSRMGAVRPVVPPPTQTLTERLESLGHVLTAAQSKALAFDEAWGRLSSEEVAAFDQWGREQPPPAGLSHAAREAWDRAQSAVEARQQMHTALKPWVIRHERPQRRDYHPGRAIVDADVADSSGLDIPESSALPFLLAAQAQAVAIDEKGSGRPLFAYGIASSYEAFRRLGSDELEAMLDRDDSGDGSEAGSVTVGVGATSGSSQAIWWYRKEIDRALGNSVVRDAHPKVNATVTKATELWAHGEKCLIFCWFIKTGEAVERALAKRIDSLILLTAANAFGVADLDEAKAELDRLSDRLFRRESSAYERTRERLSRDLSKYAGGYEDVLDLAVDAAIRHLRTPSYLVRYTPLSTNLSGDDLWAGISGDNPTHTVLLTKWRRFAERLAKARRQVESVDDGDDTDSEFARVRTALLGVQNDEEASGRGASLHPVRRASGQTDRSVRERLIALFNTPFSPDSLVASSVMGEGIDLHQECRYVIHHDLDWNPSILEQRAGRLDRIGALAEREGRPIEVYEPFLAGTHDEKMFRVVKDGGQWFDVVMGRPSGADEHATDSEENRVPLHHGIRQALTMDLSSPRPAV